MFHYAVSITIEALSSVEIVLFFAYMDVGNRETHGAVSDQHQEAQDSHMDVGVRAMQGAIAGARLNRVAR